jgi:hypothetical protein
MAQCPLWLAVIDGSIQKCISSPPRRGSSPQSTQLAGRTFVGRPFLEMTKSVTEVGISARYLALATALCFFPPFQFSPLVAVPCIAGETDCDETYSFTGPTQAVGAGG